MRATKFEFEKRFWIICTIYFAGFFLSVFDHVSFIAALRHLIAPSVIPGSAEASRVCPNSNLIWFPACFSRGSAAHMGRGLFANRSRTRHCATFEALVADGPFRYTRNPLYLANLPVAAGIGVLQPSRSGFIFLVLANWIFVYRLIFREEESLLKTRGILSAYAGGARFWPALKRAYSVRKSPPRVEVRLSRGESFVWLFGARRVVDRGRR